MKNRLFLLLLVSFVFVVSSFSAFGELGYLISPDMLNGSTISNLTHYKNVSGTLSINLTFYGINATHAAPVNVTFSWMFWGNGSDGGNILLNTTIQNTTKNQTQWVYSFVTTNLIEGIYNLSIGISNVTTEGAGNTVVSFWNLSKAFEIRVDRTAPYINSFLMNVSNTSNFTTSTFGKLSFNATVNDTNSTVTSVKFGFYNNLNTTGFNVTGTRNMSYGLWSGEVDLSKLSDGRYTVFVHAGDTLNNVNSDAGNMTFTIDNTVPTVSVSCTSNPTAGQTVTCTCTASDALSTLISGKGFSGGGLTESTTAAGTGLFTSSTCAATDHMGNKKTATGSWTVAAASTSGNGPGGSSSGVVVKALGQFNKKVWTSVNKGETVSLDVADFEVAVSKVSFTAAQNAYGVTLQVQKVSVLPKDVPALDKNVYKYVSISQVNLAKAIEGEVGVTFKVSTTWLAEQSLVKENVALHRFVGGVWVALPTTFSEEDGGYVTYTAQTPGFSYFAIAEGKATPAPVVEKKEEGSGVEGKEVTAGGKDVSAGTSSSSVAAEGGSSSATGATQVMGASSTSLWVVVVLIGVVVIGVAWWLMTRKKKGAVSKKK